MNLEFEAIAADVADEVQAIMDEHFPLGLKSATDEAIESGRARLVLTTSASAQVS